MPPQLGRATEETGTTAPPACRRCTPPRSRASDATASRPDDAPVDQRDRDRIVGKELAVTIRTLLPVLIAGRQPENDQAGEPGAALDVHSAQLRRMPDVGVVTMPVRTHSAVTIAVRSCSEIAWYFACCRSIAVTPIASLLSASWASSSASAESQ